MSNKYSIVTGASRGLGAAIAEELAREGYDVVITYCTQADKAQKVKKQLETKFGVRVESYQLDIKDEEAVLAFRKWVEETLGKSSGACQQCRHLCKYARRGDCVENVLRHY